MRRTVAFLSALLVVLALALSPAGLRLTRTVRAEPPPERCEECQAGVGARFNQCIAVHGENEQRCYDDFNEGIVRCFRNFCEQ